MRDPGRLPLWSVAALTALLSSAVFAAELEPKHWLERMSEASRNLDYHGVLSFMDGTGLASFHYAHMVRDGVRHERLVHRDGPFRGLRRTGERMFFYAQPGDGMLASVTSSEPLTEELDSIIVPEIDPDSKFYKFIWMGEERVANRQAVRICLMPKTKDRHGLDLWLDKDSALVLRSRYFNAELSVLEEVKFARLTIGEVPASQLQELNPSVPSSPEVEIASLQKIPATAAITKRQRKVSWHPEWLPQGFKITSKRYRRLDHAGSAPLCALTYSDGVATFSVIVDQDVEEFDKAVETQRGAATTVIRPTRGPLGSEHLVVVTGEIPMITARKIAARVNYRQASP